MTEAETAPKAAGAGNTERSCRASRDSQASANPRDRRDGWTERAPRRDPGARLKVLMGYLIEGVDSTEGELQRQPILERGRPLQEKIETRSHPTTLVAIIQAVFRCGTDCLLPAG